MKNQKLLIAAVITSFLLVGIMSGNQQTSSNPESAEAAQGTITDVNPPGTHGKIRRTDDGSNKEYQFQIPQDTNNLLPPLSEGDAVTFDLENGRTATDVEVVGELLIPAGEDLFQTVSAEVQVVLPADFFGPGSFPFVDPIQLEGVPLDTSDTGLADTIIERKNDALFPLPLPSNQTVPIELIALNLVSTGPITVDFNDHQEEWLVVMGLSDDPQPIGLMEIFRIQPEGGTFSAELNVNVQPKFIFTRESDGAVQVLDTGIEGLPPINFSGGPDSWVTEKPEGFFRCSQNFCPGIDDAGDVDTIELEDLPDAWDIDPVPLPDICENNVEVQGCQKVADECKSKCQKKGAEGFVLVVDHALEDSGCFIDPSLCPTDPFVNPKEILLESCTVTKQIPDNGLVTCIDVICSCEWYTKFAGK